MNPFFSIIIPTYNRAHLIANTIQSVLNQSYPHFEIIVVDDGSTDNTEDIIASFDSPKIRYIKIKNSERGYARNYGAKQAKGEWLYFLDSDDKLYPNHLEVANNLLLSNSELVIFHLAYEEIDKEGNIIRKNINLSSTSLIKGNTYGCHGMFLRKSFFQQFYFNEDRTIAGLEDWELWLRISAQYPIPHFPIITSALIQHDQRSVLLTKKESLINRVNAFMNYVLNNQDIVHTYKNKLHLFRCSCYTYISLHLALSGKYKSTSFYYLLKGIIENPLFIFQRRFFAIIKHIILTW